MSRNAYKFSHEFLNAVVKALGLEGRKVRKITLEMEVDKPILLYVEEYATFSSDEPYLIARLLELATWDSGAGYQSAQQPTKD